MVNEAALRAVRQGRRAVNQEDLLISFETVIAGAEKKGTVITEQEKRIIAYHEVGHALSAAKQKNAQPVTKITIVPHTEGALGYTLHLPEEEKFLMSKEDIFTEIRTLLAGRCAEELVFDTQTSGAANDIEQATRLARAMITRYGMSDEFGMVAMEQLTNQYLGGDTTLACAAETANRIDEVVRKLIAAQYEKACGILRENLQQLHALAKYLYENETITGEEFMDILQKTTPKIAASQAQ
jgi:cell division protease FtsH